MCTHEVLTLDPILDSISIRITKTPYVLTVGSVQLVTFLAAVSIVEAAHCKNL
jgi:hypothetical protein